MLYENSLELDEILIFFDPRRTSESETHTPNLLLYHDQTQATMDDGDGADELRV